MFRVGKLNGSKPKFILIATEEEYYQLKGFGIKIKDTVKITNKNLFDIDDGTSDKIIPDFASSLLYSVCSDFYKVQFERKNKRIYSSHIANINNLIEQGVALSGAQSRLKRKDDENKNNILNNWYMVLKEIEGLGYKDTYIKEVITFAMNDVIPLERRKRWPGWKSKFTTIDTLLSISSNGLTKWENIVKSYESSKRAILDQLTYTENRSAREVDEL